MAERPLDDIDFAIVAVLAQDARRSNKSLAHTVGLSQSSCLQRVRRLWDRGVLQGTYTVVAPEALGIGVQAMVAVRLVRHTRDEVQSFRDHALSCPEIIACHHLAGSVDFLLHVVARDPDHLRDIALDAFTSRPEVANVETSLLFESVEKRVLPAYVGPNVSPPSAGTAGPGGA